MSEKPTIQVPAAALKQTDVISEDPDRRGEPVAWTIVGRQWSRFTVLADEVLIVDYVTDDGTEGRHAFECPDELVTVLLPGYPEVAAA